jgi:hypothetical protein
MGRSVDMQPTSSPSPWKVSLITAVVTSILTFLFALIAASWNDRLERGRRVEQERREVYGNLRGVQHQVESLLGARMNTRIRKEYTEAMIRIIGEQHSQRGMFIDEARRLVQAEEALDVQTGQALRELHKYVAMAEALFPRSLELRKHIEKVYAFTGVRIQEFDKPQKEHLTADNIESWYNKANDSARAFLLREFQEPTNALLGYLIGQIPAQ